MDLSSLPLDSLLALEAEFEKVFSPDSKDPARAVGRILRDHFEDELLTNLKSVDRYPNIISNPAHLEQASWLRGERVRLEDLLADPYLGMARVLKSAIADKQRKLAEAEGRRA